MKPRIFIGSSSEQISISYALQENLENEALCVPWNQGIFNLSSSTSQDLLSSLSQFDYAIFILAPDDLTILRDVNVKTARDNVIFEAGLFIGALGIKKVFFLTPRGEKELHIPTDLLGIQPGQYTVPENDGDILAALGPFCNKIRREISKFSETFIPRSAPVPPHNIAETTNEMNLDINNFGSSTIREKSTLFFDDRIASAFPGIRGLNWFDNPGEAIDRLEILLKSPIFFDNSEGHYTATDPIWWWRGYRSLYLQRFERLSQSKILLDSQELVLTRLAVYRSNSPSKNFVYIETLPEEQIGVNDYSQEYIDNKIATFGFASEEYALFDGIPITRLCYDDGAAVIDGKVTDTSGSSLRIRYLSNYNLLISAKFSSINLRSIDDYCEVAMNELLQNINKLDEFISIVEQLPKHRMDED